MKYLIASDFHGNESAYEKLIELALKHKPDKVVLLGDYFDGGGVYVVNNALKKIFTQILLVKGNCDYPTEYNSLDGGLRGDGFYEENGGRRYYFTHGNVYGRYALPPLLGQNDVIFYGHFHFPEIAKAGGTWRVCVGSAGRPRGSEASFCLFDEKTVKIVSLMTGKTIVETEI